MKIGPSAAEFNFQSTGTNENSTTTQKTIKTGEGQKTKQKTRTIQTTTKTVFRSRPAYFFPENFLTRSFRVPDRRYVGPMRTGGVRFHAGPSQQFSRAPSSWVAVHLLVSARELCCKTL